MTSPPSSSGSGAKWGLISIALSTMPLWWIRAIGFHGGEWIGFGVPPIVWTASIIMAYVAGGRSWKAMWWALPFGLLAYKEVIAYGWFLVALRLQDGTIGP